MPPGVTERTSRPHFCKRPCEGQVAQSTVPFPRWENQGSESPSNWPKVTKLEVNESTGTRCLPASESRCGAAGSGTCRQRCVWAPGLPTTKAPA